jgi:general secretion pathway protein B
MSYILEALKKSETERRQGQAPDLGNTVQMVHRPRKKPVAVVAWLGLALVLNAAILGVVFWPELRAALFSQAPAGGSGPLEVTDTKAADSPVVAEKVAAPAPTNAVNEKVLEPSRAEKDYGEPTIIVPRPGGDSSGLTVTPPPGRVPHLVELPLSFQKSVPDLMFNSHIVSSNPAASSVMVNNQYLRIGDRMGSLWLESINEDAVVFRKGDQRFRVGAQRNWVSPD